MEEIERFQVLNSYAKSINQLAKWDIQLAYELSYRIIQYWIYGIEPPENSNPYMLSSFEQIKIPISKCRAKSWNAKKNWEIVWNQNEIKTKSNWNQTKIKSKENIKYKNKNKKENIKEKKLFWDFVLLTDNEYSKLKEIFWEQRLNQVINQMNNAIGQHWYTYKSHYFAIRNWFSKEIEELEAKKKREEKNKSLPDYDHLDPILMP